MNAFLSTKQSLINNDILIELSDIESSDLGDVIVSFGDGTDINGLSYNILSHKYTQAGEYTITITLNSNVITNSVVIFTELPKFGLSVLENDYSRLDLPYKYNFQTKFPSNYFLTDTIFNTVVNRLYDNFIFLHSLAAETIDTTTPYSYIRNLNLIDNESGTYEWVQSYSSDIGLNNLIDIQLYSNKNISYFILFGQEFVSIISNAHRKNPNKILMFDGSENGSGYTNIKSGCVDNNGFVYVVENGSELHKIYIDYSRGTRELVLKRTQYQNITDIFFIKNINILLVCHENGISILDKNFNPISILDGTSPEAFFYENEIPLKIYVGNFVNEIYVVTSLGNLIVISLDDYKKIYKTNLTERYNDITLLPLIENNINNLNKLTGVYTNNYLLLHFDETIIKISNRGKIISKLELNDYNQGSKSSCFDENGNIFIASSSIQIGIDKSNVWHYQEDYSYLDLSSINPSSFDSVFHSLESLKINKNEYVQSWIYTKYFRKLIYNHILLYKSLNKKLNFYYNSDGSLRGFFITEYTVNELSNSDLFTFNYNQIILQSEYVMHFVFYRIVNEITKMQNELLSLLTPSVVGYPSFTSLE